MGREIKFKNVKLLVEDQLVEQFNTQDWHAHDIRNKLAAEEKRARRFAGHPNNILA